MPAFQNIRRPDSSVIGSYDQPDLQEHFRQIVAVGTVAFVASFLLQFFRFRINFFLLISVAFCFCLILVSQLSGLGGIGC